MTSLILVKFRVKNIIAKLMILLFKWRKRQITWKIKLFNLIISENMHLVKKKSLKHIVPFVYLIRGQFVIYIYILTSKYVLFSIFDEFRPKAECLRSRDTQLVTNAVEGEDPCPNIGAFWSSMDWDGNLRLEMSLKRNGKIVDRWIILVCM